MVTYTLFFFFYGIILNYCVEHRNKILKFLQSSLMNFGNIRLASDLGVHIVSWLPFLTQFQLFFTAFLPQWRFGRNDV